MNRLDREDKTKKLPTSRSSRAITIIGLCSLAAIVAIVLFTSERNLDGMSDLVYGVGFHPTQATTCIFGLADTTQCFGSSDRGDCYRTRHPSARHTGRIC